MIIGNNSYFVSSIINKLGARLSLKDMGLLHFFLGVEIIQTRQGLFLSHHKYIHDFLTNTNMSGARQVSTPLSTSQSLKLINDTSSVDSTEIAGLLEACSISH